MKKPICEIEFWCIHELTLSDEQKALVQKLNPGVLPIMVTGLITYDEAARWPTETSCRSSPAIRHIPGELVETKNTCYVLKGPGRTSNSLSLDYAEEVGRSMMILSGAGKLVDGKIVLADNAEQIPSAEKSIH